MRALIQRVTTASVLVENKIVGHIGKGLLVLLGIEPEDNHEDIEYLVKKCAHLRIFDNEQGVMNFSITEIKGQVLIVSQFTLSASTNKGNRPSYIRAAKPDLALLRYELFIQKMKEENLKVESGLFGAMMQVSLINDGPVTIWLDSKNRKY